MRSRPPDPAPLDVSMQLQHLWTFHKSANQSVIIGFSSCRSLHRKVFQHAFLTIFFLSSDYTLVSGRSEGSLLRQICFHRTSSGVSAVRACLMLPVACLFGWSANPFVTLALRLVTLQIPDSTWSFERSCAAHLSFRDTVLF